MWCLGVELSCLHVCVCVSTVCAAPMEATGGRWSLWEQELQKGVNLGT